MGEQLLEIKNGGDFPADLGQRLERVRIETAALIETGIGERDGDVGAELGHDRHVSRREVVASRLLRILSAPMGRDLWISGTTISEFMPGTSST